MQALSSWIADITQPQHPLYHPVQAFLFGSVSYLGTACFLKTPPKNAMLVTVTAYGISQFTAPLFSKWLEPYEEISLVPFAGQVVHLTDSFIIANCTCHIAGRSIPFKALMPQILFFLTAGSTFQFALLKLRQRIAVAIQDDY